MSEKDYFLTWSSQRGPAPMSITGGQGVHLKMADGSRWLDLGSLSYQASLGFGNKAIVSAIQKQAEQLCLTLPNAEFPAKEKLAKRLLELAPEGFSKVFFTLGGAEANENAMKLARLVTGRHKYLARYRSYHGASLGALALTGDFRRPPLEPGLGNVIHVLGRNASDLEEIMELEGPGSIAAVFMEPIPGANGVLLPSPDYWPRMRAACDAHGTLLVADEVLTGFGRTGRCFGFEHEGVVPDMISIAKALTAGYAPLGAVLVHERVASHFDDSVLYAGLTNYAHPLGCAAALAALEEYETKSLYSRAATLEPVLLSGLQEMVNANPERVSGARGRGLLGAVDISGDAAFWQRLRSETEKRKIVLHLSEQRKTAIFAPPLIIEKAVLEEGLREFANALSQAGKSR